MVVFLNTCTIRMYCALRTFILIFNFITFIILNKIEKDCVINYDYCPLRFVN